jgi:hypothetical protein
MALSDALSMYRASWELSYQIPLEEVLKATELDLIRFYHVINAVPVILNTRR